MDRVVRLFLVVISHVVDTQPEMQGVTLSCYATNERGLRLYARVGFQVEGRRREQVFLEGRWVDEIVMGLWLTPKPESGPP